MAPAPDPTALTATQPLEAALPSEVAGRGQGWFSEYRRYPIFSSRWGRARLRPYLVVIGVILLALLVPIVMDLSGPPPLGGFVSLALQLLVPTLAGPWLCCQVRRRGLAPAREWAALVTVIAGLVLAMIAFQEWGAEPLKQWLAEQTGAVDAQGKRKKVIMAIGVSVTTPEDQAKDAARDKLTDGLPTPWANLLSGAALSFWLAGGAGLWGLRRERAALESLARERELAHAQARRREAEMQLSVLAAQVEPHFLFNTLAGVRSAIATDPSRASDMIDRLVDYLRAAIPRLRSDGGAEATLGSQLDIVRAYLALMHARMPRLSHDIALPANLATVPCPPLMLISLAENAVKHGAEPKIGPVHIRIEARHSGQGRVEVTVADNGAGFSETTPSGGGLGLTNIRDRLRQMHGERASLSLRAQPAGGVAATLAWPLD
jgi:signal transduction histidine kinase